MARPQQTVTFSDKYHLTRRICAAVFLVILSAGAASGAFHIAKTDQKSLKVSVQKLEQSIREKNRTKPEDARRSFTDSLIAQERIDEVVATITRQAASLNIRISSMTIQGQSASDLNLGRLNINIEAVSEYTSMKSFLQDILDRYSSISVENLSMRKKPGESGQIAIQLNLAVYLNH